MTSVDSILGAIEFGSQQWFWPVVGMIAVGFLLLLASYRDSSQPFAFKTLLITLKVCGIGLVALCLLNPTLVQNQIRPGENIIVLLVDNSASMKIQEQGDESRGSRVIAMLERDREEWLTRLTQDFDLRRYAFDDRLNQIEDFPALEFDGRRSQLTAALKSIERRFRNRPLAGIMLLSDGNASDFSELVTLDLKVPLYPILDAVNEAPLFDISVDQLAVTESPFEDAPVTVTATIATTSETDVRVIVSLQEKDATEDKTGQQKTITVHRNAPATVRFQLKPESPGVRFYRLSITPDDNSEASLDLQEATLKNNQRLLTIDRETRKNRILYVAGRPNWEYKFFNRAVAEDREIDLVSMIRIAKKEAKFDFRGRVGEEANSLFRGQNREVDEETESFDQAVIIRLNTRDAEELRDGFPKTKEELYKYDAVILDDIEASFFTPDQQTLLDRFVSERGGGLMMLGGRDSFRHGKWHKTPLRDVLPVYLDQSGESHAGHLKWDLTREGWLEPWMRVRSTEVEEQQRLVEAPALQILSSARETKPGARVFSEIEDESTGRFPAVVAQQYGRGRSVAVLVGDLWRWSIKRGENDEDDLAQSWRQMVRWLVAEVPHPLETEIEWVELGSTPTVQFSVRLRTKEYQPRENATVSISVQPPEGEAMTLDAEPSLEEPGLFVATFVPRDEGAYMAEVQVDGEVETPSQSMKLGWTTQPDEEEFRRIEIHRDALESLAKRSSGKVITVSELPEFVRELPHKEMPVTEIKTTPLWHSPLILLLALFCFASEWGLRRWKGLP